jgi:hypothetical protein
MSDEFSRPPEQEDEFLLPDWLMETDSPESEADLALEEATAIGVVPGDGAPGIPRRRYIFRSSEWTRVSPRLFRCGVTIVSSDGEFAGEAEGPEIPGVRAEIAARATLEALNNAEGDHVAMALKGARVMRIFESPLVVVGVYGMNTGESLPLVGACLVRHSVEQAAILATLQAVDRWLTWQAQKGHG